MKNQAEVHALLLKIAAAVEELATVIGADDVPDDWEARGGIFEKEKKVFRSCDLFSFTKQIMWSTLIGYKT
jgi:hypothetical protein